VPATGSVGVDLPEIRSPLANSADLAFASTFVINMERFGALLFQRGGTPAWELDIHHGAFLRALELTGDWSASWRIASEIPGGAAFAPEVAMLTSMGVLVKTVVANSQTPITEAQASRKIADEIGHSRRRTGLKAPTLLTIYPDLFCQQRCSFCFLTQSDKGDHGITVSTALEPEPWLQLLRQAKELGVAGISLLGGEPTLYRGLPAIIRECQELELSLGITSNGLSVPKEVRELLKESESTMMCFSLESMDPAIHKRHTGVDNRVVLKTMDAFHRDGITFNVNTVGLGQSYEDLCAIADACGSYEARVWFLNLYYAKEMHPRAFPGYSWYGEMDTQLRAYTGSSHPNLQYQMFGCQLYWTQPEERLAQPSSATEYNKAISGCAAGINQLEILPDGTALPCMQMDLETYNCGNVFVSGLEEVWYEAEVLTHLRQKLISDHSACGVCPFAERCRGGCPERQRIAESEKGERVDHMCPHLPDDVTLRLA